jgi:hypothetical protein
VEVQGLQLALFSYQEPDNIVDLGSGSGLGGFLPLVNLQDVTYQQVYQMIVSSYPFLQTKTVESVRYQIVAGTNFMIEFHNYPFSRDRFFVIANKPLGSGAPTVTSIYKNGVDIGNSIASSLSIPGAFNYEADVTFKGLYAYFRKSV